MKVVVAHEVQQSKFDEVQELVAASLIRDIDLNGVTLTVERGEYTFVEKSKEEDSVDATRVLHAVHSVIDDSRDVPAGMGLTIFNCLYDRA